VAARRKRYALVIEIVPPSWNAHHEKQALCPSSLPLVETIRFFVTNCKIKKTKTSGRWDLRPSIESKEKR
jgi:hypothetical protein